ncbi:MAG: DUF3048 domain-containing protein [Candidatus Levybacteria bacterium]|nr:DUF3048 domain-containing protein [Candidatus Levybacteria bacterium]
MNNKITLVILALIVYISTAAGSYMFFASSREAAYAPPPTSTPDKGNDFEAIVFDPSKPRTQECPLNGAKYSKEQEKWWKSHRPLGIMIENHEDSRPQSGVSFADVVYEAVAEGGITRFLAVYYCQDAGIVGPVRSARTYFLDWISEYGDYPLYAHVGGANTPGPANALGQIGDYGWNQYNDLNQFSIGFPTFRRDESRLGRQVATEHTMYSTTSKLWDVAKSRRLTNKDKEGAIWDENFEQYKFKDDAPTSERGSIKDIHIEFWDGYSEYFVNWTYDPTTNSYLRSNRGDSHMDNNTDKQYSAKNVVVLKMIESPANDGYDGNAHRLYRSKGTGDAIIFQDGKEIKGKWKKASREDRTIITGPNGSPVEFDRGVIWFEIVPTTGTVEAK